MPWGPLVLVLAPSRPKALILAAPHEGEMHRGGERRVQNGKRSMSLHDFSKILVLSYLPQFYPTFFFFFYFHERSLGSVDFLRIIHLFRTKIGEFSKHTEPCLLHDMVGWSLKGQRDCHNKMFILSSDCNKLMDLIKSVLCLRLSVCFSSLLLYMLLICF